MHPQHSLGHLMNILSTSALYSIRKKYVPYSFALLVLFIFSNLSPLYAQKLPSEGHSQISGIVINANNEAIPFANVVLYHLSDSSLIKGTTSDIDGKFMLKARAGEYYLKISFLSYETKIISPLQVADKVKALGRIRLQEHSKQLDEVEVTAERSQMELKLDKRVFNIESDLSNAGANAAEILNNIPSVEVDVEGNISLRGSENVRVLIDGKPSAITGSSTADVLRQFQGNMIERVEVITNPSARYEAEGEVGIINIVLKKEKKKGLNGSIDAAVGYPDNYRLAYNFNFRAKKLNFFSSYGLSYRKSPGVSKLLQQFNNPDTSYFYKSEADRERGGLANNLRLGTDWFIGDKSTITFAGIFTHSDEENITKLSYEDLFANGELLRKVDRKDVEDEIGENLETSINYTKKFDKEDHQFTIDLQWSERDDEEKSNIREVDFSTNDELIQKSDNLEASQNFLIQSDYAHPIGKNGLFETGVRATLRTVENDFQVIESLNGGTFAILPEFNNSFIYNEDIYAAYLMFGNKWKKLSYQAGVRTEYSEISTELKFTREINKWDFLNLFPSAFLTFEKSKATSFQASYSRRINRPRFRHLMPFQTFSDNRNLWGGNPNLRPEYTDSYELSLLKYFTKGSLFSSLYYRHRTGVINRITIVNDEGFTVRQPVNLSTEDNFGLEINGNYRFSKKVTLNGNLNFYQAFARGSFNGENLDNDVFTWNGRSTLKSEILPKFDFQVAFNYRAPRKTSQGKRKSVYFFDISFAKEILSGKGTLVASARDLLNTNRRRSTVDTEFLYSESDFQWRSRQFLLSFNYRINQKKSKQQNQAGGNFNDDF